MGSSTYKGNEIFAKELEDELMKFTKKDEDYNMGVALNEQTGEIQRNKDVDINITECTKSLGNKLFEEECRDTTESSSSFGTSGCGVENVDSLGDSEDFCDDAASVFMTRKKLTTHWRSFIQPLMWRCEWVELQIKKLQTQAWQYGRDLEARNKQKQTNLENSSLEDGVKSLPYSQANTRSDVLKRKKRRKIEATMDVAAYMSHHNLFSYHENEKGSSECAVMSNVPKNLAAHKVNTNDGFCSNDDLLAVEPRPRDNSLEHLLWKIYYLQSQVGKLKDRVNRQMTENADRLSCANILNLPMSHDALTPDIGDGMPVGTYIASQLISEYNLGEICATDSAITSHGNVPDAKGRTTHPCFADAYENIEDGVLIDNQRVKDELNNFEEMRIAPVEKPLLLSDGLSNASKEEVDNSNEGKIHEIQSYTLNKVPGNSNPSILSELEVPTDDQPPTKVRSLAKLTAPKSKKKRRRKGTSRWSRRPKG